MGARSILPLVVHLARSPRLAPDGSKAEPALSAHFTPTLRKGPQVQRATRSTPTPQRVLGGCLPGLLRLPAPGKGHCSAGWRRTAAVTTQVSCGQRHPRTARPLPTGSGMLPAPSERRGPPWLILIRKSPLARVSAFNRRSFTDRGEAVLPVDFYSCGSGCSFVDKWLTTIFP